MTLLRMLYPLTHTYSILYRDRRHTDTIYIYSIYNNYNYIITSYHMFVCTTVFVLFCKPDLGMKSQVRSSQPLRLEFREWRGQAPQLERRVYQEAMAFYADEEKRLKKQWAPKVPNPALQAAMQARPSLSYTALGFPFFLCQKLQKLGVLKALRFFITFSAIVDVQVRANFKVAFLNEFRKDARGALTAYIKAYEQLLKESDLIDVVERMDLCNHITVRPGASR